MAHQAYALPWQTLADNFKFVYANAHYLRKTNLYPRSKPGQGKQLQHFAKVFASVIDEYSTIERKKYSTEHSAPEHRDEVVIPETTVSNIRNVVREYMKGSWRDNPEAEKDPTSRVDRTMATWISVSQNTDCHPGDEDIFTDELLRTLILYGEMDVLFRIAAHPIVCLPKLWTQGGKFAFELGGWGLAELKEAALLAYVCLNVLFLKPELYDPKTREQMLEEQTKRHVKTLPPEAYDYRLTAAYQQMLVFCTKTGDVYAHYGAHKIPHREFYGIPFGMYTTRVTWHSPAPYGNPMYYGLVPLQELVDKRFPQKYIPSKGDISIVQSLFRHFKLPQGIIQTILDMADYTPKGRLNTPADPLHIDNADELKKYLAYCWKLLVRVDMLMKANGSRLDWEYEVAEAIYKLFGIPYPKMSILVDKSDEEHAKLKGERYDMYGWAFTYDKKRVFT